MGGERSTDEAEAQWQTGARGGDMKVPHLLQSRIQKLKPRICKKYQKALKAAKKNSEAQWQTGARGGDMKVPHLLELEIQIWNMSKVLKTLKISIDDMEEWQTRARRFFLSVSSADLQNGEDVRCGTLKTATEKYQ